MLKYGMVDNNILLSASIKQFNVAALVLTLSDLICRNEGTNKSNVLGSCVHQQG